MGTSKEKTTKEAFDERLRLKWDTNGSADHTGFLAGIGKYPLYMQGNAFYEMRLLSPGSNNHSSHSYVHSVLIAADSVDLTNYLLEENDLPWRGKMKQPYEAFSHPEVRGYVKILGHHEDPVGYRIVAARDTLEGIDAAVVELHRTVQGGMKEMAASAAELMSPGTTAEAMYKAFGKSGYHPNFVRLSCYAMHPSPQRDGYAEKLSLEGGRLLTVLIDCQKLRQPIPAEFGCSEFIAQVGEGIPEKMYQALHGLAHVAVEARHSFVSNSPTSVFGGTRGPEKERAVIYCARKE